VVLAPPESLLATIVVALELLTKAINYHRFTLIFFNLRSFLFLSDFILILQRIFFTAYAHFF